MANRIIQKRDEAVERAKTQLKNQLDDKQSELNRINDNIYNLNKELQELRELQASYIKAKDVLYTSVDRRNNKLVQLESVSVNSKGARTYSGGLRNLLTGSVALQKLNNFNDAGVKLAGEIELRETLFLNFRTQKSALENQMYAMNRDLNRLEN